jgi:hypothetical protein
MAVRVSFVDGTETIYPEATSAVEGPIFRVRKWDSKRRKPEDVALFESKYVISAEVSCDGIVKEVILGAGRREPN